VKKGEQVAALPLLLPAHMDSDCHHQNHFFGVQDFANPQSPFEMEQTFYNRYI
jgi:hypothetical protein